MRRAQPSSWSNRIKLLLMTLVLTVLIWATADSLVNEQINVKAELKLLPELGSSMLVEQPQDTGPLELELFGPRRVIDSLPIPLEIDIRLFSRAPGRYELDLRELLLDRWDDYPRLAIGQVTPGKTLVVIDQLVEADVRLILVDEGGAYQVAPRLDRDTVKVRMRQSVLDDKRERGETLSLEINAARSLRDQPTGKQVTVEVPISPDPAIFGTDCEVLTRTVRLSATLTSDRREGTISTCPIQVAVSFANFGKPFKLFDDKGEQVTLLTRTIRVEGPSQTVAALLAGDRPVGIIRLKGADFDQPGVLRPFPIEFQLPQGVRFVPGSEPEPVRLRLEPVH